MQVFALTLATIPLSAILSNPSSRRRAARSFTPRPTPRVTSTRSASRPARLAAQRQLRWHAPRKLVGSGQRHRGVSAMFAFDQKSRRQAPRSPDSKSAPQRSALERSVKSLTFQPAPSSRPEAGASPAMNGTTRNYLDPVTPRPSSRAPRSSIGRAAPEADVEAESSRPVALGPQFDFTRIAVIPPAIQRRATIGSTETPYQREAGAAAVQVMQPAAPAPASVQRSPVAIQRKCAACDEEGESTIQTKRAPGAGDDATLDTEAAARATKHGGEPLPSLVRSFFESRFGHDFSQVRVHTDGRAAHAAQSVHAAAYTLGHHIVFDRGQFAPETAAGRRLIAHELAHVVQQGAGGERAEAPGSPALERAADSAAQRAGLGGGAVAVEGRARIGISRQPRSLSGTVDPSMLSEAELEREIREIRSWLMAHQEDSAERDLLLSVLPQLESRVSTPAAQQPAQSEPRRGTPRAQPPTPGAPAAMAEAAPHSLGRSVDVSRWSDAAMEEEIGRLRAWLPQNAGSPDYDAMLRTLAILEETVRSRDVPQPPAPAAAPPPPAEAAPSTGAPFFGRPIAPGAFTGIQPYHIPRTIPHTDRVVPSTIMRRGPFMIVPQLVVGPDGSESIAYFIAHRAEPGLIGPTAWNEWIIGPDSIDRFIADVRGYAGAGAAMYRSGPPSETQAASERWLWGTATYGEALGTAASDPMWWLQIVLGFAPLAGGGGGGGSRVAAGAAPELSAGTRAVAGEVAPGAVRPPFVPRVIQGGGSRAPVVGTGARATRAAPASAFDRGAARQLAPEAASAPSPLRAVPDVEAVPAPAASPATAPAVSPATAPAAAPAVGPRIAGTLGALGAQAARGRPASPPLAVAPPATSPQPQPAPDPAEERRRRRCPSGSIPINWPPPVWATLGHGDSGSTSTTYNRPTSRTVTKVPSPERNRTIIGEYVSENWSALRRYYENGTQGAIHHKWPLYLGGPDRKTNFVFLLFSEHTAWHSLLTTQTTGPVGTVYCIVN
ncbi:DUF4157 domain-containing protein [Sorangium sp. So ce185]|uniref:eCIS core domain-containing protein n=1 Tax=Sorangium sp. So ce185 TaxID=3133287 RepID=UPI003F6073CA